MCLKFSLTLEEQRVFSISLVQSVVKKQSLYHLLFSQYGVNESTLKIANHYALEKVQEHMENLYRQLRVSDWLYIYAKTGYLISNNSEERKKEFTEWNDYLTKTACHIFGITESQLHGTE